MEAFKDAGGNCWVEQLALGAIRLLTVPVSNAHVERAFSLVNILKDEARNRMIRPEKEWTDICNIETSPTVTGEL